jgi:hypothetical protein
MKDFDEFRFNRLEERAWRLERELKARGKADADDIEETEKHSEPNKEAGENHGRPI